MCWYKCQYECMQLGSFSNLILRIYECQQHLVLFLFFQRWFERSLHHTKMRTNIVIVWIRILIQMNMQSSVNWLIKKNYSTCCNNRFGKITNCHTDKIFHRFYVCHHTIAPRKWSIWPAMKKLSCRYEPCLLVIHVNTSAISALIDDNSLQILNGSAVWGNACPLVL